MSKRVAAGLELGSAALLGAALAAAYAGPMRFVVFGTAISIRTLWRPMIAAAVVLALRIWLLRNQSRGTGATASIVRVWTGALVVAGVMGWVTYLSATCGGSDSYGYVSAAERILAARLVQEEPLASVLPFDNAIRAACPLGYVPSGRVANASVPAYSLGLPAIMAVAAAVLGRPGPFIVAPLFGLVLLCAAYVTALGWYRDREAALLACALLTLHPLVFTYSIQPMSDVPAAAALMVAVAALSREPSWPVMAGAASAVALVIRPALGLASIAFALLPIVVHGRRGLRSALLYSAPVAAGVAFQGWSQWHLYGNVFGSGYGGMSGLFSTGAVLFNVRSYGYWTLLALGPVWVASLAVGVTVSGRPARLVFALMAAAIVTPYLFYRPYDHWETLRFLLPVLAVATIMAAFGLLSVARRVAGHSGGAVIATFIATMVAYSWLSWLSVNRVFVMPEHEARHRFVGEMVARATTPKAVVLALQHSGSVRYYAGRQTLNWDQMPSGSLRPSVKALQDSGFPVFILIDSAEERAMFDARHGTVLDDDGWLPGGQRRNVQLFEAPH